jgi:hypothetical protein
VSPGNAGIAPLIGSYTDGIRLCEQSGQNRYLKIHAPAGGPVSGRIMRPSPALVKSYFIELFRRHPLVRSAKGAGCNSLGQRPRKNVAHIRMSAESAKSLNSQTYCSSLVYALGLPHWKLFRASSASGHAWISFLGRCPSLSHFAPLALNFLVSK